MMKYFKGIKNIEDLKEAYKKIAKELHPDNGGDTRKFQDMQNEFTDLFKRLQFTHRTEATQDQEDAQECPEAFAAVIARVAGLDGVDIEIVGRWVWLSGNTYNSRETIKAAGFFWSSKHKKWYWNGGTTKSKKHSRLGFEAIKALHGCMKVKTDRPRLATV